MSRQYYNKKTGRAKKKSKDNAEFFGEWIGEFFDLLFRFIGDTCYFFWSIFGYSKSEYRAVTHKKLFDMLFDAGARGEYLIYRHLRSLQGEKRWLFNVYLPREDGRTTEVDVILFHESGVYVFESKNYSGWIFGTETEKVWTQSIKHDGYARNKKYHFLNPIMQNQLHIRVLKEHLPMLPEQALHSIVLFGSRCRLKKINLTSGKHTVITRNSLTRKIGSCSCAKRLKHDEIEQMYQLLYPMSQVSDEVRQKHVADINRELKAYKAAEFQPHGASESAPFMPPSRPAPAREQKAPPVNSAPSPTNERRNPLAPPAPPKTTPAESSSEESAAPLCPRCGQPLVLRQAKKGANAGNSFWGCSAFPKCRYTKQESK